MGLQLDSEQLVLVLFFKLQGTKTTQLGSNLVSQGFEQVGSLTGLQFKFEQVALNF